MAGCDDDPDRAIPAVLLQQLHRSTISAILKDPQSLRNSISGPAGEASGNDAGAVFSQLQNARRERRRKLQKQCLKAWLNKQDDDLVVECFWAFRKNAKEAVIERGLEEAAERERIRLLRLKERQAAARQSLANLSGKSDRVLTEAEIQVLGSYVKFLPPSGRNKTDAYVIGVTTSGKGWELSDGTFIKKDFENHHWVWSDCPKAQVAIPSGPSRARRASSAPREEQVHRPLTQRQIGFLEAERAKKGILWTFKQPPNALSRPQSARVRGGSRPASAGAQRPASAGSLRPASAGTRLLHGHIGDDGQPRYVCMNITLPRQDMFKL
jgi:hypothetical protein